MSAENFNNIKSPAAPRALAVFLHDGVTDRFESDTHSQRLALSALETRELRLYSTRDAT
jgi:hypothetical protein